MNFDSTDNNFSYPRTQTKWLWSESEDRHLFRVVSEHGPKNWNFIASFIPGRTAKQCRERWHNHLNPELKKGKWTKEEDAVVIEQTRLLGFKWAYIAKLLPGRADNDIKNRYNRFLKKLVESKEESAATVADNRGLNLLSQNSHQLSNSLINSTLTSPSIPTTSFTNTISTTIITTPNSSLTNFTSSTEVVGEKRKFIPYEHNPNNTTISAKKLCQLPGPSQLLSNFIVHQHHHSISSSSPSISSLSSSSLSSSQSPLSSSQSPLSSSFSNQISSSYSSPFPSLSSSQNIIDHYRQNNIHSVDPQEDLSPLPSCIELVSSIQDVLKKPL